jgi:hypothetical protein
MYINAINETVYVDRAMNTLLFDSRRIRGTERSMHWEVDAAYRKHPENHRQEQIPRLAADSAENVS